MFRAIGKFFRAIGDLFTGKVDNARKDLQTNPNVVQATFDRIIREKKQRIHQYKDAVAMMIAQQEKKAGRVRQLTEDVTRLEQLKEGAAAKARELVAKMKTDGVSLADIKSSPDYIRCMTAFNDFTSTSNEKSQHISELEEDVAEIGESINGHKVQLQQLLREIDKLKTESAETVTEMITAREEEEIADMISGISKDKTSKELADLRDLRDQQKARARVAREMADTDTMVQEAEFMEYARTSTATSEFDQLIGLAEEADVPAERDADAPVNEPRLPE